MLKEMTLQRADTIDRCINLGKQFIKHYYKVYVGGVNDRDFEHHCHEMQTLLNGVREITLSHNKKKLSTIQLKEWCFMRGSSLEYLFSSALERESYSKLINQLIFSSIDLSNVMINILGGTL